MNEEKKKIVAILDYGRSNSCDVYVLDKRKVFSTVVGQGTGQKPFDVMTNRLTFYSPFPEPVVATPDTRLKEAEVETVEQWPVLMEHLTQSKAEIERLKEENKLLQQSCNAHGLMLLDAARYGYEYHANTQFPDLSFDDNCKNNYKQHLFSSNPPEYIFKQLTETDRLKEENEALKTQTLNAVRGIIEAEIKMHENHREFGDDYNDCTLQIHTLKSIQTEINKLQS